MEETQYGIIDINPDVKSDLPLIKLLKVPSKNGSLIVNYLAFGPNNFPNNAVEMKKSYAHPITGEEISFRELTTSKSIDAAAYDFKNLAKPNIFNPRWLQVGWIVRTQEGVFANPQRNAQGDFIVDKGKLNSLLKNAKKIKVEKGRIYLGDNDFGFAEYDSFTRGKQDADTFVQGGLAKVLEHAETPVAEKLHAMASTYKLGVNVFRFDPVSEPVSSVVGLGSYWDFDVNRLRVYSDYGFWDDNLGYAFGGLVSCEAGAPKK